MAKHIGNLTVTKENVHSFPAAEEFYGHLTIAAGAELRATKLTMVRGWVTVQAGGSLTAPVLGLIDGWLTVDGWFSAIHLTEVRNDMVVNITSTIDLPALALAGQIVMRSNKNLVSLKEVRDSVTLLANAQLQADRLERIGKSLTLRQNAVLEAPALAHIGGYADIDETATLVAPRFIA